MRKRKRSTSITDWRCWRWCPTTPAVPPIGCWERACTSLGRRGVPRGGVFGLDRKTLRKWGLALRSGDGKWLAEVLAGRSGRRKLTLEMESDVRFRWLTLRAERRRDYRRRLQEELERVFGVRVSGETLRPLLRELRGGGRAKAGSAGEEAAGGARGGGGAAGTRGGGGRGGG